MADPRHNSRVVAVQQLFELSFDETSPKSFDETDFNLDELTGINEDFKFDKKLTQDIIDGVMEHHTIIDKIITKFAPEWPIENISKTDLQILRIGIYEAFLGQITPERVAINEAIELAKEFSNDASRKFVNGVLGSIIKDKTGLNKLISKSIDTETATGQTKEIEE